MDGVTPDRELLGHFADMVELNELESSKVPDHDASSQKWVGWLIPKAQQQGWIALCVEQKLLPEVWLKWPQHNDVYPPKLKAVKANGKSVRAVPGDAIKQNRQKH